MCTHLNRLNLPILSSSSLTSDIWIKSITSREQKKNTCNYLGNYTRSRWWNSLSHFIESSTRWQHQMKACICYSFSGTCLIGITHWPPFPRPPLTGHYPAQEKIKMNISVLPNALCSMPTTRAASWSPAVLNDITPTPFVILEFVRKRKWKYSNRELYNCYNMYVCTLKIE
jgi:hypothetical protein